MIDDATLKAFVEDWWRGYVAYEGEEGRAYVTNVFNTISKQHLIDFLRDALIELGEQNDPH
jgi:hypothetical protein